MIKWIIVGVSVEADVLLALRTEMRKSNKNLVQGEQKKIYFELKQNYSSKMH
jgi:hypothetical protein